MRLIDADNLRKNMEFICMGIMAGTEPNNAPLTEIDNAPTVEYPFYQEAYQTGYEEGKNERAHKAYNDGFKDGVDQGIKLSERPQGEWIYEYDDFYHCSICGKVICTEWDKLSLKKHFPFCHCGAKMEGGEEE